MRLTQAQMARELHISRSTMSDNVKAGCPLESVGAAKHWRSCNVREKWNQAAHDASERTRPRLAEVEASSAEDEGELRELSRLVTHDEFAALLEIEFQRFEAEAPKRRKSKTLPVSFCPSLMLGVWACKGLMAYGANNDPRELASMVNIFMSEVRDGNGDYLYRGLSDNPDAKLSSGFVMLMEAADEEERRKAKPTRKKIPAKG